MRQQARDQGHKRPMPPNCRDNCVVCALTLAGPVARQRERVEAMRNSFFPKIAVLSGLALAIALSPAAAFDDKPGTLDPILGMVGINTKKGGDENIDYRERAPLVVPKSTALPPPQPNAGARAGNWPVDQDVSRRREAAARERVPQQIEVNKNPALTNQELLRGRSDAPAIAGDPCETYISGAPDCAPTSMEKIKRVFSLGGGDAAKDEVVAGEEPKREYLTQPPSGYRKATRTTRATQAAGYEREDASDAQKFIRNQNKRSTDE